MNDAATSPREAEARAAGPAPTLRASLLALAATVLGAAVYVHRGTYSLAAISLLSVALVLALAGALMPAAVCPFAWMPRAMWVILFACFAVQFVLGVCRPPVENQQFTLPVQMTPASQVVQLPLQLTLYSALWAIAGMICGQVLSPRPLLGRFALPLLIGVQVIAALWVVGRDVHPFIDVFDIQTQSAHALRIGQNPYNIHFDSTYPLSFTRQIYPAGYYSEDGQRLLFGFIYTPLSLLLALPGYVLGDVRYAMIAAVSVAAGLMGFMRPGRLGLIAAAGLLFMPRTLWVIDMSWTEPFVVMLLALTVFCALRLPKLTPYAFGLLLVSKQYLPFAVVLSPLLFGWEWRRLLAALLRAGITALVVTLPLVLPDVGAFVHSAILFQIRCPFRDGAISFMILWFHITGRMPSSLVGFLALILVAALVLWRLRPSPANFAAAVAVSYFAFFAFNKQAFMNYYFFVLAGLWCAVAAMPFPEPPAASPQPAV
jgi:hypothetical protein